MVGPKNWDILELLEKHSLELSNLKGNVDLVVGATLSRIFHGRKTSE